MGKALFGFDCYKNIEKQYCKKKALPVRLEALLYICWKPDTNDWNKNSQKGLFFVFSFIDLILEFCVMDEYILIHLSSKHKKFELILRWDNVRICQDWKVNAR